MGCTSVPLRNDDESTCAGSGVQKQNSSRQVWSPGGLHYLPFAMTMSPLNVRRSSPASGDPDILQANASIRDACRR